MVLENVHISKLSPRGRLGLWSIGLVAAVVFVYWNGLHAPFLFDDRGAVVNNPTIRRLDSWAVFNPPSDGSTTTGRPIVNFSFALNYAVGGTTAWGYRAFNIAIHALSALLLMGILRRTFLAPLLRERFGAAAQTLAFLTALVWAVHPLETESITCIAQRTESLCALFYFLALYAFIRGAGETENNSKSLSTESKSRGWFALSFVACLLGMGTKEVMVTAPMVILLYDRTFLAESFSAIWQRRRLRYLALASTWIFLGWLVVRVGGARGSSAGFGFGVSWWQYLLKQNEAILLYLKLCFWPHPLVLDYGTAVVKTLGEVWWQAIVVVGLLMGTIWALARKPALGFAGACFFVILGPSSSFVPLVGQTMAEHRMYLPSAAIMAVTAASLYLWLGWRSRWTLGIAAMIFGALTVARNQEYNDTLHMWAESVEHSPQNARAHNNLAWSLQMNGKPDEANVHFSRAIELQPGYVSAHYNWGVALLDQKRVSQAITEFEVAVRLAPEHADAYLNLGNALMQVQRAAEAVPRYEQALRLQPGADAHYDLGVALVAVGKGAEAAGHFRAALKEQPSLAEAHYQLACLDDDGGRSAQAEAEYSETLKLAPDHLGARSRLGLLFARSDRLTLAAEQFHALLHLKPEDADAHANLGNVFLLQNDVRSAIAEYEEALRLRPGDPRTRENLQLARESLR